MMNVSWTALKQLITQKGLPPQYIEDAEVLNVFFVDGSLVVTAQIDKRLQLDDLADFDLNYRAQANVRIDVQKDAENAPIQRLKMAPTGWTYKLRGLEFVTGEPTNLYSKTWDDVDHADIAYKFFDANRNEITDQQLINTNSTEMWVDWEPPHDYELIGGTAKILDSTTQDVRLWCVAVPDVPAAAGGSKVMIDGINFKFMANDDKIQADGRVSKRMFYSDVYHTNKLRFIIKYPAGTTVSFHIMLEFFRP